MTTKHELQLDLLVLRAARELIELGHFRYVCNAIDRSSTELTGSEATSNRLQAWIKSMLGYTTLETWLRVHCHASEYEVNNCIYDPELKEKIRNTRLAWLDWMISECEKSHGNDNT